MLNLGFAILTSLIVPTLVNVSVKYPVSFLSVLVSCIPFYTILGPVKIYLVV